MWHVRCLNRGFWCRRIDSLHFFPLKWVIFGVLPYFGFCVWRARRKMTKFSVEALLIHVWCLNGIFDATESIPDVYFHLKWVFFGFCTLFCVFRAAHKAENDISVFQANIPHVSPVRCINKQFTLPYHVPKLPIFNKPKINYTELQNLQKLTKFSQLVIYIQDCLNEYSKIAIFSYLKTHFNVAVGTPKWASNELIYILLY